MACVAQAWAGDQGRRAGPPPHLGPLTCDQGQATLAFGLDHSPAHLIPLGLWPCSPFPGGPLGLAWVPALLLTQPRVTDTSPGSTRLSLPLFGEARGGCAEHLMTLYRGAHPTAHSGRPVEEPVVSGRDPGRRASGMRWPGRAQRATWQFCLLPAEILQSKSHSWSWGPHLAPPFLAWSTRGWGGRVALNSSHLTPLRGLSL